MILWRESAQRLMIFFFHQVLVLICAWIQSTLSYNYALQSMWNSQRIEINSSKKRWWMLSDQAVKVINIFSLVCRVKSASFFMISESLKSSQSTRQLLSEKVLRSSASSQRSSWVQIEREDEYESTCQANRCRRELSVYSKWVRSRIKDRNALFKCIIYLFATCHEYDVDYLITIWKVVIIE